VSNKLQNIAILLNVKSLLTSGCTDTIWNLRQCCIWLEVGRRWIVV